MSATEVSNPIKKKVDALIEKKLHTDQDFIGMMSYVSPMIDDLDIHTRRRLLHDLEDKKIQANRSYLESFGKVNNCVQTFASKVRDLNKICEDMSNRIQSNKARTQDLLARTSALQNEKRVLERRQMAVNEFLNQYTLTEDEECSLRGSEIDGTIDGKFFVSLNRVKQIHDESKSLLRTSGHHLAALEIMDEMANKLEQSYEVLYRSIQRECRLLNVDFIELKGILVQSIAALQDRGVLFKYALDEYTTARRNHIVRSYIDALTRGGSGGTPKPIELLSHDPIRYIGDMLAWIHQAMATERELMQALLKLCQPQVLEENSSSILSQISEALCRPFKMRVEQALTNETHCVLLYRLSCLFRFYEETMAPSLKSDALLIKTITELRELTLNMFFNSLTSTVQKLISKMNSPDYDLLPVPAVHQVLMLLKDALESHESTVATVADKKDNFSKIFALVLDPLNQAIQISATQLHSSLDIAVYTLNCLAAINAVVLLYHFTDTCLEKIKAQIEANEDLLVSEQATSILSRIGLVDVYTKAAAHQPNQGPLAEISGMEPSRISAALVSFDSFLSNPDNYHLDQCAKLSSVRIRDSVRQRTMENVVGAYRIIHEKLTDQKNNYPAFPLKTVDEIEQLLKGCT